MAIIPTVRVVSDSGFIVINKSDYDPQKHQIYEEVKGVEIPFSEPSKISLETRRKQLEEMSWQELKSICNYYKLERLKDETYSDLIPSILECECVEGAYDY